MPNCNKINMVFPPAPTFTDENLPSLRGRVYIVTGAASGVGFELAKILYEAGGKVYLACRSEARCSEAIERLKVAEKTPRKGKKSKVVELGELAAMVIDLSNLTTIKPAAEKFLVAESRLDVLVHNAAVMSPPVGSKSKQGHDLEMGTNCLGPYLLTLLLEPALRSTAAPMSEFGKVRIVWVVSLLQAASGEMHFDDQGTPKVLERGFTQMENYMQTKAGDVWLAAEFANRLGDQGILSISVHPGLMRTELQRNMPFPGPQIMKAIFKPAVYGAYSELYTGFSPQLTKEHNGGYVMAWGRIADLPDGYQLGLKSKSEGGNGAAKKFLKYCDREVKDFL